jgi:hypothetical protein
MIKRGRARRRIGRNHHCSASFVCATVNAIRAAKDRPHDPIWRACAHCPKRLPQSRLLEQQREELIED